MRNLLDIDELCSVVRSQDTHREGGGPDICLIKFRLRHKKAEKISLYNYQFLLNTLPIEGAKNAYLAILY